MKSQVNLKVIKITLAINSDLLDANQFWRKHFNSQAPSNFVNCFWFSFPPTRRWTLSSKRCFLITYSAHRRQVVQTALFSGQMVHNKSQCKRTWHLHLPLLACTEGTMSWWRVQLFCPQSFANLWPQLKRKKMFQYHTDRIWNPFPVCMPVLHLRSGCKHTGNMTYYPRDCIVFL